MPYQYGHWISNIEFNSNEYFGFIYRITNKTNNRKYIGKRNFIIKSKHYLDWQNYISSSREVKNDIKILGKTHFIFEILELCKTNAELSDREIDIQRQNNVLTSKLNDGSREFYNRSIHGIGFNTTGCPRSKNTCSAVDGSKFYYNPATNECKRIIDLNNVPENFIEGRPPSIFENKRGKLLFYNSITGKQLWLDHDEDVPNGYLKGGSANQHPRFKNGNDNIMADKKIYRFHNVITGEKFTGTQCEFKKHTGLPNWVSNVICKKVQKISKNWELTLDA